MVSSVIRVISLLVITLALVGLYNLATHTTTTSLYGNDLYNWCIHCEIDVTV